MNIWSTMGRWKTVGEFCGCIVSGFAGAVGALETLWGHNRRVFRDIVGRTVGTLGEFFWDIVVGRLVGTLVGSLETL